MKAFSKRLDAATLTAQSQISRRDAVRLIAERVRDPNDSVRQARNKVSHRITYALDTGKLTASNAGFVLGDVVLWARAEWPGKLSGLPASPIAASASSSMVITDGYDVDIIPGSLDRCQEALKQAYDHIESMQAELHGLRSENERLRPLAEKWEALCESNRQSAQKPRGG